MVSARAPAAVGSKVTAKEQLAPAVRLAPQVLDPDTIVKSAVLGLPTTNPVTVAALVLVTVTDCCALVVPITNAANARPADVSFIAGAVATFDPLRLTTCVPVPALSVNVMVPICVPTAPVGVNWMPREQEALGMSVSVQKPLDIVKFPDATTLEMIRGSLPELT